jgi:hypothetical protein
MEQRRSLRLTTNRMLLLVAVVVLILQEHLFYTLG